MYKVRSLRSGNIYTVYGLNGTLFLLRKNGKWIYESIDYYEPVEES